jgi:DHA1 family bicyclomycin/chloramphenicol resistance-like MFS transporter
MIGARRPAALLGILMLASAASMMATDLYAPSLPFLPGLLGTTPEAAQLTLSLHLAAYAAGTLLHGPLSDAYGRRPVLLWGMGALAATSLLCAIATGIGELILFRIFQGLAAAAEGVVVLAIIRDAFDGDAQVRALAWYGVATSVTPALAPVLGAYLYLWFGWRVTFGVMAAVAFTAGLLIAWGVPESRPVTVRAPRPVAVVRAYLSLLADWRYLRHALIGGAAVAVPYVFATGGPFVVVEHFGLPVPYFGYLQALLVVCFVAGSLAAGRWAGRAGAARILGAGVAAFMAGAVLLALAQVSGRETLAGFSLSLALIAFALGPVFATVPKLTLDATAVDTGAAAALLIALEIALGSAGGLLVGSLYDGTSRPMMLTLVVLATVMGLAFRLGRSGPAR